MKPRSCLRRAVLAAVVFQLSACVPTDDTGPAGAARASAGEQAIRKHGCGTCHVIPGIDGANGNVGPSLAGVGRHVYLAGRLPNTPENLAQWIVSPQRFNPATAMPDMQVSLPDARAIAAFLGRPQ